MADEVENHTIRLLQEMRDTMRRIESRLDRVDQRFDDADGRMADLVQRIDGNTLTFNLVAGVVYNHEDRIAELEGGRS